MKNTIGQRPRRLLPRALGLVALFVAGGAARSSGRVSSRPAARLYLTVSIIGDGKVPKQAEGAEGNLLREEVSNEIDT
jgi:hypothetical protein